MYFILIFVKLHIQSAQVEDKFDSLSTFPQPFLTLCYYCTYMIITVTYTFSSFIHNQ